MNCEITISKCFPAYRIAGAKLQQKPRLSKFVDVNRDAALEVGGLVLVDQADLGEFVDHRIDLGGVGLGRGLVGGVADVADSVTSRACIIPVMQAMPLALAIGFFSGCCICHCLYF